MKIIFFGVHNKPGILPLSPATKSGTLISRIVKRVPPLIPILLTNLYNTDCMPAPALKKYHAADSVTAVNIELLDIVVLLGHEVHVNFPLAVSDRIIMLPHPSCVWSNSAKREYVKKALEAINYFLN